MRKWMSMTWGLSVIFLFFMSCVIAVVDDRGTDRFPLPGEFHKILSFESGGTIALENGNGDILISGWDKDEIEIRAEKIVSRQFGRRVQFFNRGDLEPKVWVDPQDGLIKISTEESARDTETMRVHYKLNVPHSVNLKDILNRNGDIHISDLFGRIWVDLEEGDVRIENFSGTLDVSVSRGSVDAEVLDLREEDVVKILVQEGDITLTLERGAVASIDAVVPHGDLSSDFDLKSREGTRISLTALNGDIRIKKGE